MKNIIIVITLMFLTVGSVFAQDNSVGGSVVYDSYLGLGSSYGLNVSYDNVRSEKVFWRFNFQYSLGSFKDQYGAYAILPGIDPASIQVDADIKANSYLIGFDYKQYFLSASNTSDGGLYFLIGFGFNLTKRKTSFDYGNYDGSNYVFEPTSGIASQSTFKYFSMKGGLGYDIDIVEYVKLYIEGNARFTALKIGMSEAVEINIPTVIGASLGIRFQL